MVLTSDMGWPYSWRENKLIVDCYVNCEVDRAWQIVSGDLTEWFSPHGGADFKPKRRLLVGTPGIGRSMAAGSYLLYQLLHYDVEQLQVVIYVIAEKAFLFDKTAKTVTRYINLSAMEYFFDLESPRGMRGYVIYDVLVKGRNPSFFLFLPNGA
ncbi:putative retrotransposon hot spot (RHS) protein [Trypanosoma cruzi]|uniref:Putative retrotransposon hot spot (RHS) protein n=1 Tax=Trypanosoma cruzi TaxID=5693 RepID=A0A2V2X1M3_TRYCR|nr:putative retrotransposon hot spot (RHS) protein [Trypanosoma cruzi]RNC36537.1 putative retrotransposon hot spot (RHS) protein [Trypanosoma cruzi]